MVNHSPIVNSCAKSAGAWRMSQRGFTITEIAITVAVLAIVTLGSGYVIQDMAKIQKRTSAISAIVQMRATMIAAIEGTHVTDADIALKQTAWDKTIADNTPVVGNVWAACLLNHTPCPKNTGTVGYPVLLKNADDTELFNSRRATRGFDTNGRLCDGFSVLAPNAACPFSWEIRAFSSCPADSAAVSCENPMIEIRGRLQYQPGSVEVISGVLNVDQYAFVVRRGERKNLNQPVVLSYVEDDNTGETESGNCGGSGAERRFNRIVNDPGENARLAVANPTQFSLKPGIYECRIQVPAFKNGDNYIELWSVTDDAILATSPGVVASTARGSSVMVMIHTTLRVFGNDPTVYHPYKIVHRCSNPAASSFPMGVPVPAAGDYTGSTYSTISCVKTG